MCMYLLLMCTLSVNDITSITTYSNVAAKAPEEVVAYILEYPLRILLKILK